MTVHVVDVGDHVECDLCSTDYTGKPDTGGLLFGSKACCPTCAPRIEREAIQEGEERFIKARCPEGMPFAAWVLSLRNGDNQIRVYTGDDAEALPVRTAAVSPEDLATVAAMLRYGGSFVQALAAAARLADPDNLVRLKLAFPEYWTKYRDMAATAALAKGTDL